MSEIGNVLQNCAPGYKNTGFNKSCFTEFGAPVGILFCQFGQTFPTTSVSALKTALSAAILNDLPYQRMYPVQDIVDIIDGSEKPVVVTNNLGGKKKVRDGFTDLMLGWWDGAFCLLYALRQMNNTLMPFLIVTNKGFLVGTDAGSGLMKGITATLKDAEPFGWSDGAKLNTYNLHLNFDPAQTNENVKFVDFSGTSGGGLAYLSSLTGLENILLGEISRLGGLVNVSLTTGCGGVNLYSVYPTQFVSGLWVAYADNAGVPNMSKPIAITSVTPSSTLKGYAVQLNTSDSNYSALQAPGTPTLTGSATGGTLAAATYYIKQTALNAYGETIGSSESNYVASGSTSSIGVANTAVAGAVGYRTYIGTSAGGENFYFASVTPNITLTSQAGTVGTVPTVNTATSPIWIGLSGPTELFAAGIGGTDGSSGFEAQLVSMV